MITHQQPVDIVEMYSNLEVGYNKCVSGQSVDMNVILRNGVENISATHKKSVMITNDGGIERKTLLMF